MSHAPTTCQSLNTGDEGLRFLHRAALALGATSTLGDDLYEQIAELLREPFPDTIMVVASFDHRVTIFHPEYFSGPPGTHEAIETLLANNPFGYDVSCQDDNWRTLLEPRLQLIKGGVEEITWGQIPREDCQTFEQRMGIERCYAMGLAHERALLGALLVLAPHPLTRVQRETVQAYVQHASTFLLRKKAEDELRSVAGKLESSVGRRTRELSDTVTHIKNQERLLRGLLDASNEAAVLVGLDGTLLACNEQAAQRAGLPMDELVGRQGVALMPPELVASRQRRIAEAARLGRTVHFVERQGDRAMDCSVSPIFGDDGQIDGYAIYGRDVTEPARLEARLRRAGAFQKALFQSISEGILVLGADGTVVEANLAALEAFGMERSEMVGRPGISLCAQLASWEEWEREHAPRVLEGGEPVVFELRMRRQDGSAFMAHVGASRITVPGDAGSSVIWVVRDVTAELLRVEQLEYLATHDDLTGLPNRLLFQDRLDRARAQARRYEGAFALMLMDLDGFKEVNDTHGHELGDQLLGAIGTRLRASLRAADTFSRMGGDEFAVLLPSTLSQQQAVEVGRKLLGALERPFLLGGHELQVSASIGVAMFPEHDGLRHDLLARADQAMYAAKRAGGAQVIMASEGLGDRS